MVLILTEILAAGAKIKAQTKLPIKMTAATTPIMMRFFNESRVRIFLG